MVCQEPLAAAHFGHGEAAVNGQFRDAQPLPGRRRLVHASGEGAAQVVGLEHIKLVGAGLPVAQLVDDAPELRQAHIVPAAQRHQRGVLVVVVELREQFQMRDEVAPPPQNDLQVRQEPQQRQPPVHPRRVHPRCARRLGRVGLKVPHEGRKALRLVNGVNVRPMGVLCHHGAAGVSVVHVQHRGRDVRPAQQLHRPQPALPGDELIPDPLRIGPHHDGLEQPSVGNVCRQFFQRLERKARAIVQARHDLPHHGTDKRGSRWGCAHEEKPSPLVRRLVNPFRVTIRWSSTSTSRSFPASTIWRVTRMSSGLGELSPEG